MTQKPRDPQIQAKMVYFTQKWILGFKHSITEKESFDPVNQNKHKGQEKRKSTEDIKTES